MSKGTIRFPASAITGGRVGTARIREGISDAAARLESPNPEDLDPVIALLAGRTSPFPRKTLIAGTTSDAHQTQALRTPGLVDRDEAFHAPPGYAARVDVMRAKEFADVASLLAPTPVERMQQLGRTHRGKQNKTETAYETEVLKPQLHAGEILWYRFEAMKLRLADNTFITIDYAVITAAGALEFREVKGRWTDDARAKTKIAAAQYPFRFIAVQRVGRHGWRTEDLTGKHW